MAVAAAAPGIGEDAEGPAQQRARLPHFPFGDQLADLAAGNVMPAQQLLGIDRGLETKLFAQVGQRVHVALRLMAEVEVVAFVHFARVQGLDQHLPGEVVRRHQREVAGERQHQHGIHAGLLQQLAA